MKSLITKWLPVLRGSVLAACLLMPPVALSAQQQDGNEKGRSTESKNHFSAQTDPENCIKQAAKMNLATIEFARLATQKAENPELKRFGQTLEQDHRKAQTELETIAKNHNVTLPTSADEKCLKEVEKLRALSGEEFDQEFAKGAVEGHAMAVAHLRQASAQVKEPDIAKYTRDMMTKIRDHQRRSREIALAVGVDQSTIASLENKANEAAGSAAESETSAESGTTTPSKESKEPQR